MNANEKLLDESIRHQIDLQHYSNGVVHRIIGLLNNLDKKLYADLTLALENLSQTGFNAERLESLLGSVRAINAAAYGLVARELTEELRTFSQYESSYQAQALASVTPIQVHVASISADQAFAAAYAQPFRISKDGAVPMAQYLEGLTSDRAKMIRDAVSLGFVDGETTDSIVRRIKGTKARNYEDGLMAAPRRHLEGMVRTATNHLSNVTRQKTFEANSDIVKSWIFLATLDGRTSITCASLSGKTFPVGLGPVPPRHINCRSIATPVLKSLKEITGLDIEDFKPTERASMDGVLPADTTFTGWLRSKPAGFQDGVLGSTRGKLFRANEIDVDSFTNRKGVVYSLDDLRKRDAELFKKAGI